MSWLPILLIAWVVVDVVLVAAVAYVARRPDHEIAATPSTPLAAVAHVRRSGRPRRTVR